MPYECEPTRRSDSGKRTIAGPWALAVGLQLAYRAPLGHAFLPILRVRSDRAQLEHFPDPAAGERADLLFVHIEINCGGFVRNRRFDAARSADGRDRRGGRRFVSPANAPIHKPHNECSRQRAAHVRAKRHATAGAGRTEVQNERAKIQEEPERNHDPGGYPEFTTEHAEENPPEITEIDPGARKH